METNIAKSTKFVVNFISNNLGDHYLKFAAPAFSPHVRRKAHGVAELLPLDPTKPTTAGRHRSSTAYVISAADQVLGLLDGHLPGVDGGGDSVPVCLPARHTRP